MMKSSAVPGVLVAALGLILAIPQWSLAGETASSSSKRIRQAVVAGAFYSADPIALRKTVEDSLKAAKPRKFPLPIRALMAPHAGYMYCSDGLAAAYRQVQEIAFPYDTVVLVGPSHRFPTRAGAVSSADAWKTPLGPVAVDTEKARRIVERIDGIEFDDRAHAREHSLEVQLPYLLAAAKGKPFKIVPIVTSSSNPVDHETLADAIVDLAREPRTLIVLSTDLSHYPDSKNAEKSDKAILAAIMTLNADAVLAEDRKIMRHAPKGLAVTMCGMDALCAFQRAAARLGITRAELLSYTHSGMVSGDNRRVVGYGAVAFLGSEKIPQDSGRKNKPFTLSGQSRQELIRLARSTVTAAIAGDWVSFDEVGLPELQARLGCFVTLKKGARLRGCMGCFTSNEPLWKTVREMAISAATRDPRFMGNPITSDEVPQLSIEVSVLSKPRLVRDPLKEIELGRDGIIVKDQGRSGTFLPQVATETGWSLEEFLGHCARDKAGLGWEGWKKPSAKVYTYTAFIIHEKR